MLSKNSSLDLNNASRKLLTQLPGVSKDVAYRIVNYRNRHGGFSDWADVATAIGFSRAEMAVLKTRALLGPRPAPVTHERQVISRWRGKPDDELHGHG
jgi:hypothetical protein